MACCSCEPDPPEGATSMIGRMEFAGSGLCNDARPISFKTTKTGDCCMPSEPTDPKWTAARPGLEPFLSEVDSYAKIDNCCFVFSMREPFESKKDLDQQWLPRVNDYLA